MAKQISQKEFEAHNNYFNSFHATEMFRDYRYEPGFRLKKVMFAYRQMNDKRQTSIYVTFNKHDFNCNERNNPDKVAVQNSNYVKVGPVVLPKIGKVGQIIISEITDYCTQKGIYGIFFFATRKPHYGWPVDQFNGKLYVYIRQRIPTLNPVAIISAVFPYYNHRTNIPNYKVYLLFDHRPENKYYQGRLTRVENAEGIHEMSPEYALINMGRQCGLLIEPHLNHRYAAIVVGRFTTLTVFFENNKSDPLNPYKRPGFPKHICHERVLIQRGGCVGLEKYHLRYQFMDDPTEKVYLNLQELAETNKVNSVDDSDMAVIVNPLIVLGATDDTTGEPNKQETSPGYGLIVTNTHPGHLREATLLFPTGAVIANVRNFYPDSYYMDDHNRPQYISPASEYAATLWEKNYYKESTGPYANAEEEIDGQIRSAFVGGYGPALAP